jgi:hypothetical protein
MHDVSCELRAARNDATELERRGSRECADGERVEKFVNTSR